MRRYRSDLYDYDQYLGEAFPFGRKKKVDMPVNTTNKAESIINNLPDEISIDRSNPTGRTLYNTYVSALMIVKNLITNSFYDNTSSFYTRQTRDAFRNLFDAITNFIDLISLGSAHSTDADYFIDMRNKVIEAATCLGYDIEPEISTSLYSLKHMNEQYSRQHNHRIVEDIDYPHSYEIFDSIPDIVEEELEEFGYPLDDQDIENITDNCLAEVENLDLRNINLYDLVDDQIELYFNSLIITEAISRVPGNHWTLPLVQANLDYLNNLAIAAARSKLVPRMQAGRRENVKAITNEEKLVVYYMASLSIPWDDLCEELYARATPTMQEIYDWLDTNYC